MKQLGIGIIGLHEGRTLLVGVNVPIPSVVGTQAGDKTRVEHVRVVAGCDIRQEAIDAARSVCPNIYYTTDYMDLLARPDVDIVAIYTPDHLHGDHVVRAFEAGKEVICTKPLVNSVEDARRVLAASRSTGRKLLVGQSMRFFEPFMRQRQAFERGEIGEVEMADAHYIHRMDWYYDKSPWATHLSDWVYLGLSHPLDLVRWYLGVIQEVHAFGYHSTLARRYNVQSHDIYVVNLRAVDGRVARVMGHYGLHELPSARNAIELTLYGAGGTSMAQYHDMRYFHTAPDGSEVKEDLLYSQRAYYYNNEVHGMHYGEFANYAEYFARALLEGRGYGPALEEGLETFCLMEAVRLSAESGKPVLLAPILEEIGLR